MRTLKLKFLICFFGLSGFFYAEVHSQTGDYTIHIIDATNRQPVAAAHILDDRGNFIALTDNNGAFYLSDESLKSIKSANLYISHLSYEDHSFPVASLFKQEAPMIALERRTVMLDEVVISSKKGKKDEDAYVLRRFFRGWQLQDSVMKYYYDGIMECAIPISGKGKVSYQVLQYRFFRNDSLLILENKKFVSVSIGFGAIPKIYREMKLQDLPDFRMVPSDSAANLYFLYDLQSENDQLGEVRIDSSSRVRSMMLYRDKFYYANNPVNILGYSGNEVENYTSLTYSENPFGLHEDRFEQNLKRSLGKKRKDKMLIENHMERYTIQFNYTSDKNGKKRINDKRSYYYEPFWREYEKKYPLPSIIKRNIQAELTLAKNGYRK